ncbi:hypothetical protein Lepil_3542 [Leptonema illini DSM 21528]|uniref:Uncharacterized protein n=1 Tax=Leptonema illini DSM 21528 TaxID=929563 RepID=H2CJN8_9LEPT|nr:SIR2 family protein [Leptonema illini]EHQ08199.1 hypothetical protein Lepil_3542 [Leptonema illini DSM 21528]
MRNKEEVESLFRYIVSEIAEQRVVVFVGSGFSLNARPADNRNLRMRTWDELKRMVQQRLGLSEKEAQKINTPRLIQLFESRFDLRQRNDLIAEAIPNDAVEPGPLHRELVKFNWDSIVTTNIDTLIERAFKFEKRACTVISQEHAMARIKTMPIYKIHGSYEDEATWIFSEKEYNQNVQPLFIDKLRTIFAEKTVLFVGYSLNDPDLDAILYQIQARLGHFQRRAYLVSLDDQTIHRAYWLQRNIDIISASDVDRVSGHVESCNVGSHSVFLEAFLETLHQFEGGNPISYQRESTYLWRERVLKKAMRDRAGSALDTVFLMNNELFQNRKRSTVPISEEDCNRYCDAILQLYSLCDREGFSQYRLEVLAVIFDVGDGSIYDGARLFDLVRSSLSSAFKEESTKKVATVYSLFSEALWERLVAGRLTGVDDEVLERHVKDSRKAMRKASFGKETADSLRSSILSLRILRYVSGNGMKETNLLRVLKTLLVKDSIPKRAKAYIRLRFAISCLYLNNLKSVEDCIRDKKALEKNPFWKSQWTAMLQCELGLVQEAAAVYQILRSAEYSLEVRYMATQALLDLLPVAGSFVEAIQQKREHRYDLLSRLEEIENEAVKAGVMLDAHDFIGKIRKGFIAELTEKALDESVTKQNQSEGVSITLIKSDSLQFVNGELFKRALNGMIFPQYSGGNHAICCA